MTELISVLPLEQRAAMERARRAIQNAAYFAAQKGEMILTSKRSKRVIATIDYNGTKLRADDNGRYWYIDDGQKSKIRDGQTLRILNARFREKFQMYLKRVRGSDARRNENLAYHWGEKSDRVRSWV